MCIENENENGNRLIDRLIERLVGISIENEWKKTRTCAKIKKISVTNQMKMCSE